MSPDCDYPKYHCSLKKKKKNLLPKKAKVFILLLFFFFFLVFQKLQACQWKGVIRWQVAEEVFFQGHTASHSQWLWTPSCIWLSLVRAGLLDISQASVFPHCRQTDHLFCRWNSVIYEVTWQANHQPCHKYMYKQHWYFSGTQEDKRAIPQSATTTKHSGMAFCWVPKKLQWLVQSSLRISLGGGVRVQSLSHVQLFATPWRGVIMS